MGTGPAVCGCARVAISVSSRGHGETGIRLQLGGGLHLSGGLQNRAEADGLRQAIAKGASEVVVLPYFLSAGRHVVTDIPAEIEPVRKAYPSVDIFLAPYLGAAEGVVELLMQQASRTINDYPAKTVVRPD